MRHPQTIQYQIRVAERRMDLVAVQELNDELRMDKVRRSILARPLLTPQQRLHLTELLRAEEPLERSASGPLTRREVKDPTLRATLAIERAIREACGPVGFTLSRAARERLAVEIGGYDD